MPLAMLPSKSLQHCQGQMIRAIVNPGPSYFEWCALACVHLLGYLHLHFVFSQSTVTLPWFLSLTLFQPDQIKIALT